MALISKNNQRPDLNLLGVLEEKYIELTKQELGDFIEQFLRYAAPSFENL